jgi:tripartite-type tricarboxylate transporter receptor subunit TctC
MGELQEGKIMRIKAALLGVVFALASAGPAAAEYPDKPIRIMAPYAPGGNIDVTARIIADKLRDVLGVTVLVENRAGASGMIGSDVIARSAPDGYNLLVSANSLVAVPAIYGNAPYDWKAAFQPISHIQAVPAVLVVHPDSPIKTLADFVRIGRETPGKLAIADSGVGTTNHIVIELLSDATGAKYTLVHYKGSGAASIDVVAGQVAVQVDQVNSAIGHIKAGKLRAIAISADKRLPELPDVPTMKEAGVKELAQFTYSTYTGLFGPARMPPEVLAKLHDAMAKVLTDPATIKRFADLTAEAKPSTPQELAAMLDKEDRTVVPLIKKLGIKPE